MFALRNTDFNLDNDTALAVKKSCFFRIYQISVGFLYAEFAGRKFLIKASLGIVPPFVRYNREQYAFSLYRLALENMPPQREFYTAAFRLTDKLFLEYNDEEPLRWIELAILSLEWEVRWKTNFLKTQKIRWRCLSIV